jgi:hypothetical protein
MAEIFISYARADRERAEKLAQALGQHGFSVWWDREIPPGRTFDEVIEEALSDARCVVVLWSRDSVKSEWVKTEAAEAAKRRILVPILADEVTIPLEFRRVQSARLTDWQRLTANPDWNQVTQALTGLVGRASSAPPVAQPPPRDRRPLWAVAAGVVLIAAVAGVVLVTQMDSPQPAAPQPEPPVEATAPVAQTAPDVTPTAAPADAKAASIETPASVPAPRPTASTASKPAIRPAPPAADDQATLKPSKVATVAAAPSSAPSIPPEDRGRRPETVPDTSGPAAGESRRAPSQSSFPVTYTYGVFRNQAGVLVVSADGLRYSNSTGRVDFEASCREIRRVTAPNMIADREQRTVELGLRDDRSVRFSAAETSGRNEIMSALSKICGPF